MPLSRLENFLKNAEGNILYVNPSDFDATDSYENRGNSLTRPFKTIQRALLEAARFSYVPGLNNDLIDRTTILVYPGTHYIDNRPGYTIQNIAGAAVTKRYVNQSWTTSGATLSEFTQFSNFDIFDPYNDLYKYNSIHGGVILPRGASIVGLDLRKTKIRPLYVPDPYDNSVTSSAIFRVTGTCYFSSFSILDADIKRSAYKDSTGSVVVPNFSHHKLTCFEYADGVNELVLNNENLGITDLAGYYAKISFAYGETSGRSLPNFPTFKDFEPSIDEYRIVGDLNPNPIGITSIKSGNGLAPTSTITVTTKEPHGLYKDSPFLITGITTNTNSYNGSSIVNDVLSDISFTYVSPIVPSNALPGYTFIQTGQVILESDSVSSASPYIFSCTLRSVYGMNGMFGDGSKATGFKSMLTAQFTGISLQKDDNAFILYDESNGIFNDTLNVSESQRPLHINSASIYKPDWESTHMKVANNAIFQCVSIFAIGYGRHFVAESGGDMSITNSNSNFGALSLESNGFRSDAFDRDDVGYITHVIPPREPDIKISNITWLALDAQSIISVGKTDRFYIANYKDIGVLPPNQIDGYRIGAKKGELLYLNTTIGEGELNFSSPILMTVPSGIGTSSEKIYSVGRSQNTGINSISNNIITLTQNHQFFNGESVRIFSNTGQMPSNITEDLVYNVYTTGLSANQLKLSSTLNDANVGNTISGISNQGGPLTIISTVSDKQPGEYGHPIQYDTDVKQWYIQGSSVTLYNTIYDGIVGIGVSQLGDTTGSTFVTRQLDNRSLDDRIYKLRYVIPKEFTEARPPTTGFILQESNDVGINSLSYLTTNLTDNTQLRNPKIVINASYSSGSVTIKTEFPHNFVVGDSVTIKNVLSSNNGITTSSTFQTKAYNGTYVITSIPNPKTFVYTGISSDPGSFQNLPNARSTQQQILALPTVARSKSKDTTYIYKVTQVKKFIPGSSGQDGVYNIIPISGSISPNKNIGFGISERKFTQDIRNLYPQQDRDNYNSDPLPTTSYSALYPIGKVLTNDKKRSLTKECLNYFTQNTQIGFAVTGVVITGSGNTTLTLYTGTNHNFNSIKRLTLTNPGTGYNNAAGVTTTLYSADIENGNLLGNFASVKATVSTANTITSVSIVDPGSAYGVGNTMTISAFPAQNPTSFAVVQVAEINNVIGDTLELDGFYEPLLNGVFKILSVPTTNSITVYNPKGSIGAAYTQRSDARLPQIYLSSKGLSAVSLAFTQSTGIATITCNSSHGFVVGNSFSFVGLTTFNYFNKKQIVSSIVGINTFTFNAGITTSNPSTTITNVSIHKYGFGSNGGYLTAGEENLAGRGSIIYAGISTTLSTLITVTSTTISLTSSNGFNKGDYISIGSEILRLVSDAVSGTFTVLRGQFSTPATNVPSLTLIKKIKVLPIEIRRHSILRASGHTFEYLGYGPGNYSTGLPVKQNRLLSDDEIILSQARQQDGGVVVYTGMNDKGEFYSGATKVNGATGETTIIGAPIVSYTGDDSVTILTQKNSGVFDDITVKNRITVEGGDNNNQTSQFYGPVNFSEKVTVSGDTGLETNNFFLKGLASQAKLLTVGISTPTSVNKNGDIIFLSSPSPGGYIGFVYANNQWNRWGLISRERDRSFMTIDQLGIGQSTGIYNFTDAAEINGTLKVKNLYVGGAVTFAGSQAIGQGLFDNIQVNRTVTYVGQSTNYTIRSDNANSIAQFQNAEFTGYAVTFTNPTLTVENSFNSTYAGVSTFAGTVKVGFLDLTQGRLQVGLLTAYYANIGRLGVTSEAFIPSGIITEIRTKYVGGLGNVGVGETSFSLYANSGFVTSITGTAATITTFNSTSSFLTNSRIGVLQAPLLYSDTGIITAFTSTNSSITNLVGTAATITIVDGSTYVTTPLGYINSGIITALTSRWIGGTAGNPIQININTGIITSLTGTAATFSNLVGTNNLVSQGVVYSPVGVVTIMSGTQANYSGIVTASRFASTVAQGTAPLVINSTTLVTNLNADLLDGLNSSSTDQSGGSIVSRSGGSFSANVITANQFVGTIDQPGNSYLRVGNAYFSSGGDFAHVATHEWYNGAVWTTDSVIGGMFQITGQTFSWFKHNGAGSHTQLLTLDASGNLSATGYVESQSDEKLKTNIKTIENALDKVCELRGVEYDRVDIESHQIGVIAQEVEKVFPEIVSENSEGTKSVAYGNLVGALIEAIKDLRGEITELKLEIDELKGNK